MTFTAITIASPVPGHLSTRDQRPFITPSDHNLWPDTASPAWHRRHRFRH